MAPWKLPCVSVRHRREQQAKASVSAACKHTPLLTVVLTVLQNQSKVEVVWAAPASLQLGSLQRYRPFRGLPLEHVKQCVHLDLL